MHSNRKYSEKEVRLMNVLKGIVIIIYIILGRLGILLIPEILKDFNINGYPFLHNYYIDGLIGIVVFFLIFGFFINKVTKTFKAIEHWIMHAVSGNFICNTWTYHWIIYISYGFIYSRNDWKYDIKSSSTAYYYIIAMLFRFPIWFKKRDEMLMFLPENMARSMSKSNISRT